MLLFGTGIWPYDTVAEYEKRFRLNFRDPEEVRSINFKTRFLKDLDRPEEGSHAPRVPPVYQRCSNSSTKVAKRPRMHHHVECQCTPAWTLAEIRLLRDMASETACVRISSSIEPVKQLASPTSKSSIGRRNTPRFPSQRWIMLNRLPIKMVH